MKAALKQVKAVKAKKTDRSVPVDEMRRLMRVYGSIKCLRKQKNSVSTANMKIDSVKRKFYRWFPDLDERFVKDKERGFYRPRFGHQFEMQYREEMRTKDGEILSKKRTTRRRQQQQQSALADCPPILEETAPVFADASSILAFRTASTLTDSTPVSPVSPPPPPDDAEVLPSLPYLFDQELSSRLDKGTDTKHNELLDHSNKHDLDNNHMASASIIADTEALDHSFIPEQGIFDAVEKSFYGSSSDDLDNDCPRLLESSSSSSCSSSTVEEGQCSNATRSSWDSDSPTIDVIHMLGMSIEEYCEGILA